jgi:DNA-binding CsgD family transcriptional regulator
MHDRTRDIGLSRFRPARRGGGTGTDVLEALANTATPAFATDAAGHVVFWNRAIEKLLDRPRKEALGRHCFDLIGGRDVFGNRFCHESCAVRCMIRNGEAIQGFEMVVGSTPRPEQPVHVSILEVPAAGPEDRLLVHLLQPVDQAGRLARALERLGPARTPDGPDGSPLRESGPAPPAACPLLTKRENEVLQCAAAGLQNKEVAQKLGISLATARNHIHNILEKLDVHSKLEAVSLAFRQGWVTNRKEPAIAEGDSRLAPSRRLRRLA